MPFRFSHEEEYFDYYGAKSEREIKSTIEQNLAYMICRTCPRTRRYVYQCKNCSYLITEMDKLNDPETRFCSFCWDIPRVKETNFDTRIKKSKLDRELENLKIDMRW